MSPTTTFPASTLEATIDALFETEEILPVQHHGYLTSEQEKELHAASTQEEALRLLAAWGFNVRRA